MPPYCWKYKIYLGISTEEPQRMGKLVVWDAERKLTIQAIQLDEAYAMPVIWKEIQVAMV